MIVRTLAAAFALVGLAGCGGADVDRPDTYAVTGVVTLDGTPVEGATVTFNPESREGTPAFGKTAADGTYQLTTFEAADGAIPGNYVVTATKYAANETSSSTGTTEDGGEAEGYVPPGSPGYKEPAPPKNELPQRYAAMHTSDVKVVVNENDENVSDLVLTSK